MEELISIDKYHPPLLTNIQLTSLHNNIFAIRNNNNSTNNKLAGNVCRFNFHKLDVDTLKIELRSVDWLIVLSVDNTDEMCDIFYKKLYLILNETCP